MVRCRPSWIRHVSCTRCLDRISRVVYERVELFCLKVNTGRIHPLKIPLVHNIGQVLFGMPKQLRPLGGAGSVLWFLTSGRWQEILWVLWVAGWDLMHWACSRTFHVCCIGMRSGKLGGWVKALCVMFLQLSQSSFCDAEGCCHQKVPLTCVCVDCHAYLASTQMPW